MFAPADESNESTVVTTPDLDNFHQATTAPVIPAVPVSIQGMPKEFRDYHPISGGSGKLGGAVILVLSVIFLIGVSIGVYFYIIKPYLSNQQDMANRPEVVVSQPIVTAEPAVDTALVVKPEQTPQQVYNRFIAALLVSTSFNQYYNVMIQYGSQRQISELEAEKLRLESPNIAKSVVTDFLQRNVPSHLTGGEQALEQVEASVATIVVSTDNENVLGTVEFILEDNQWKIDTMAWKYDDTEVEVLTDLIKAKDRDNDGVTDSEEAILGSSKDSADSDNDGYGDLSELLNLYNPAGKDKLVDSPKVDNYLNTAFKYSILYPSDWQVNANANKDSIMFRSQDSHFIQVLVQTKERASTLDNWYKDTFNVETINNVQRLSGKGWQGIKTLDGLYVYAQGTNNNQLFVFQYQAGSSNTAEYINLYQAMLNSFVIQ